MREKKKKACELPNKTVKWNIQFSIELLPRNITDHSIHSSTFPCLWLRCCWTTFPIFHTAIGSYQSNRCFFIYSLLELCPQWAFKIPHKTLFFFRSHRKLLIITKIHWKQIDFAMQKNNFSNVLMKVYSKWFYFWVFHLHISVDTTHSVDGIITQNHRNIQVAEPLQDHQPQAINLLYKIYFKSYP